MLYVISPFIQHKARASQVQRLLRLAVFWSYLLDLHLCRLKLTRMAVGLTVAGPEAAGGLLTESACNKLAHACICVQVRFRSLVHSTDL